MTPTDDIVVYSALVGLGTGCIGTALGVLNYWHSVDASRLKLKVNALRTRVAKDEGVAIEVVNLSQFAVTVEEVGFGGTDQRARHLVWRNWLGYAVQLPLRMEPRTSALFLFPAGFERDKWFRTVRYAYVRTACGRLIQQKNAVVRYISKRPAPV